MEISYFVVFSVIIAPHNVLTLHISKTHLPNVLLNVRELQLNCCSKEQSRKREKRAPPPPLGVCVCVCVGGGEGEAELLSCKA